MEGRGEENGDSRGDFDTEYFLKLLMCVSTMILGSYGLVSFSEMRSYMILELLEPQVFVRLAKVLGRYILQMGS